METVSTAPLVSGSPAPRRSVFALLLRCITTIAGLSLAAKGLGFLRDAAAAAIFGTSDAMDAYVLALSVPTLLAGLLGAAMPTAIIPAYALAKRKGGSESAVAVVANGIFLQAMVATGICLLLALLSQPLMQVVAGEFGGEKMQLCRNLFLLLLLFSILYSIGNAATAGLQAEKRFALGALAPAIVPLVALVSLLLFHASFGIYAMAFGLVLGSLVYLVVLSGGLLKEFGSSCFIPKFQGHGCGQLLRDSSLLLIGGAVFGGCVMIDVSIASRLEPGTVATFGYADKVIGIVLSLAGVALGQSLLPYLADLSAANDLPGLRKMGWKISWAVIAVTIPMVLALWFSADLVTQLLFQRGEFDSSATARVADALRWGSLQFPAAALGIVASKMVVSMGGVRYMCVVSTIALIANFFLDVALAPHFGLAGILIATAIVHALSAGLLFLKTLRS